MTLKIASNLILLIEPTLLLIKLWPISVSVTAAVISAKAQTVIRVKMCL